MEPVASFEDLCCFQINSNQHWYYVLLADASDPTAATRSLLQNLDKFDLATGKSCYYYLAGFINDGNEPCYEDYSRGMTKYLGKRFEVSSPKVYIERLGWVPFSYKNFVAFYQAIEHNSTTGWRYSGRCELLLFNIDSYGRINCDDFFNYDLDDIVTNGHTIGEFIHNTVIAAESIQDKTETKKYIDTVYYDLVIPADGSRNNIYDMQCARLFEASRFSNEPYCFISYCIKDYALVKQIRDALQDGGIPCWMAPFDIPRGASYAYIIEHAIRNAYCFFLMLSKNTMGSVWAEKELLRAIHYFQHRHSEKLCAVWLDRPFSLDGTQYAAPLENIQIDLELHNDIRNVYKLAGCFSEDRKAAMLAASMHEQLLNRIRHVPGFSRLVEKMTKLQSRFINRPYVVEFWKQHGLIRGQDFISCVEEAKRRFLNCRDGVFEVVTKCYQYPDGEPPVDDRFYQRCMEFLNQTDIIDKLVQSEIDVKDCFRSFETGTVGLADTIARFEEVSNKAIQAATEARDLVRKLLQPVL